VVVLRLPILCSFKQFVAESFETIFQVDVIYADFSKAFYRLGHYVLLDKLQQFSLSQSMLEIFKSYLKDINLKSSKVKGF
jgi:hypothetical protein